MVNLNLGGIIQETITPYEVLHDMIGLVRGDGVVAASSRKVRVGDLLAKNSSTNRFLVRRATEMAVQGENQDAVITVEDAHPWAVGNAIQVTGENATTVADIDYDTNQITLAAALTGQRAIGVVVYDGTNGMDDAVAIAVGGDIESKAYPQAISPAFKGNFKASKIRNFDAKAKTALGGRDIPAFDVYAI